MAEEAKKIEDEEDPSEAFEARILQLYDLYEDWTGDVGDEGEPVEAQSDGSAVIDPGAALGTFVMFALRLAGDLEVSSEQFDEVVREIREGMAEDEAFEGEDTVPRTTEAS